MFTSVMTPSAMIAIDEVGGVTPFESGPSTTDSLLPELLLSGGLDEVLDDDRDSSPSPPAPSEGSPLDSTMTEGAAQTCVRGESLAEAAWAEIVRLSLNKPVLFTTVAKYMSVQVLRIGDVDQSRPSQWQWQTKGATYRYPCGFLSQRSVKGPQGSLLINQAITSVNGAPVFSCWIQDSKPLVHVCAWKPTTACTLMYRYINPTGRNKSNIGGAQAFGLYATAVEALTLVEQPPTLPSITIPSHRIGLIGSRITPTASPPPACSTHFGGRIDHHGSMSPKSSNGSPLQPLHTMALAVDGAVAGTDARHGSNPHKRSADQNDRVQSSQRQRFSPTPPSEHDDGHTSQASSNMSSPPHMLDAFTDAGISDQATPGSALLVDYDPMKLTMPMEHTADELSWDPFDLSETSTPHLIAPLPIADPSPLPTQSNVHIPSHARDGALPALDSTKPAVQELKGVRWQISAPAATVSRASSSARPPSSIELPSATLEHQQYPGPPASNAPTSTRRKLSVSSGGGGGGGGGAGGAGGGTHKNTRLDPAAAHFNFNLAGSQAPPPPMPGPHMPLPPPLGLSAMMAAGMVLPPFTPFPPVGPMGQLFGRPPSYSDLMNPISSSLGPLKPFQPTNTVGATKTTTTSTQHRRQSQDLSTRRPRTNSDSGQSQPSVGVQQPQAQPQPQPQPQPQSQPPPVPGPAPTTPILASDQASVSTASAPSAPLDIASGLLVLSQLVSVMAAVPQGLTSVYNVPFDVPALPKPLKIHVVLQGDDESLLVRLPRTFVDQFKSSY